MSPPQEIDVDAYNLLLRRFERERRAREQAEALLEAKSLELFTSNQALKALASSLETQVIARTEELQRARDEAVAANEAKSLFLAHMSHEIRTPMNGVLGMLHVLAKGELNEHKRQYVKTALGSAELLLTVINDILDLSKLEAGALEFEAVEFDLQSLVENSIAQQQAVAQRKGITLVGSITPEVPRQLVGDPTRLQQVLTNLLNNAIKFSEQGEILLYVAMQDASVHFGVVDSGIGIGEEKQHILFEPFRQADSSFSRKYGGTGLGLTICDRLVTGMGGHMQVASAPGHGAEFSFALPLPPGKSSPTTQSLTGFPPAMIVSPSHYLCASLRNLLQRNGITTCHETTHLEDAAKALATDSTAYNEINILVDAATLSGTEPALQILLTAAHRRASRVIAIIDEQESLPLSFAGKLAKPIREHDLLMVLQTSPDQPKPASTASKPSAGTQRKPVYHLLLAEDNETNQFVIQQMLKDTNVAIDVCNNGEKAIQAVQGARYDLVLMDVQMPTMDGMEATRRIRSLGGAWLTLPIVALTAHAMNEHANKCLESGMDAHLTKPVSPEALIGTLKKWLDIESITPVTDAADNIDCLPPDIDLIGTQRRLGGNESIVRKLFSIFRQSQQNTAQRLNDFVEKKQWHQAFEITHALKGASANIGANPLALSAAKLEQALQNEDEEQIEHHLSRTLAALERVLKQLEMQVTQTYK